jgi:GABA permease
MLETAGMRFLRDTLKRVVVMRRCLVVANQTLQAAELRDELRKRISAGPCSFFVIVPDTKAVQYDPVAAGGVLPQPGMWWWATHYARPATDEEATAQARERLSLMLDGLAALGAPVEGDLGSSDPLEANEKVCADRQFDEIIVTTLPQHVSRWLRSDLPHQAERRFGLPVTTMITSY